MRSSDPGASAGKRRIRLFSFCLLMTVFMSWAIPAGGENGKFSTLADFIGKSISMLNGTNFDSHMEKNEVLQGNVKILYQNSDVDSITSVLSGKSDALIMDMPNAEIVVSEHQEFVIFPEVVQEDSYGFGFQKGSPLVAPFNEAMQKLLAQGLADEMTVKWMGTDETAKVLIPQDWEGKNGTLRYWVNTGTPPMSYLGPDGTPIGYSVDYVLHVAREMDYKVEITECAFDGLIPALQGGKADLAGRTMSITEERKKMIDFSDPFFSGGSVFVVRKDRVSEELLASSAPAAADSVSATGDQNGKYTTLADFINNKISVLTGTSFDIHLENNSEIQGNVKILYQNSDVDSIASVLSGKSDALIMDMPNAEIVVSEHQEFVIFPEVVQEDSYGFGFQKGSPLVAPFNEAMQKLLAQGLADEMTVKWMGTDETAKVLIPQDWEGKNGTLRYWVNTGTPPMSYLGPDGTPVGYAIDFVLHVAREMDYKVEITECAFDGLIPALQGGKADLAGRSMSITEERLKKIDFSDPFYRGGSVFVVRKSDVNPVLLTSLSTETVQNEDTSFFASISASFQRTFVEEDRWAVFVTGLLNTLLITFASMILGCILGFALFFLCRKTGNHVRRIVQSVTGVIVGIPAVVLLMVLFYVVFGRSTISGIIVSIIAFTLTFGTSVFHMLETGTGAVELGQTEGAYALGFNDNETFFRVILPQALMHVLPIFRGEVVSLLKATAVVGYIAVQDLTRSGDMVRNRTFEAFFSLISVAVIYYVVGKLLGLLITGIQKKIDPSRRSEKQILKGVNVHV